MIEKQNNNENNNITVVKKGIIYYLLFLLSLPFRLIFFLFKKGYKVFKIGMGWYEVEKERKEYLKRIDNAMSNKYFEDEII